MKTLSRSTFGLTLALTVLLLLATPVQAQEDESGEDEGWGKLLLEYGTWVAQPEGLVGGVATLDLPLDPFDATIIGPEHSSETEHWVRVGADFARNVGRITFTRYAHESDATMSMRDPSQFRFGELLAFPEYAGYANDGRADAFDASNAGSLRDTRIDFSRVAFSNSRVEGRWVAGIRRVTLNSATEATYFALVPDFPPIGPGQVTFPAALAPIPDTAEMSSRFSGGGLSGGMEFRAPLGTPKLVLEAAFNMAVLVGSVDSSYRSETHFYRVGLQTLDAPYDDFALPGFTDTVTQDTAGFGLQTESQSTNSQVLELSLGFRWDALDYMNVYAGFRSTQYGNVVSEIRPKGVVSVGSATNLVDASETLRSVSYEGFYLGIGFRF